jgi:hypothetical protein
MKFKNQSDMFAWIWENRDHVSEVSGKPLFPKGHWQFHWQFAHLIGKGPFPSFKLREENIMLMLPIEHENQEQFPEFIKRREEMKQKYYQENQIKKI